eukprot:COSAG01_NODE_5939_length_3941_cov_35.353462_6_plen_87_part_00
MEAFLEAQLPAARGRLPLLTAVCRRALALKADPNFPVCRHPSGDDGAGVCSLGSCVMVADGSAPHLICAQGPADGHGGVIFETFRF